MTYAEVMSRTPADFWMMLWPLYLLIFGLLCNMFAAWINPKGRK